jgi:hypothetical protein
MRKLAIYKLYGVIVGLASTAIAIANFYLLSLGKNVTIVPDPLNRIELILAIFAIPAIIMLFSDLAHSEEQIHNPENFVRKTDNN